MIGTIALAAASVLSGCTIWLPRGIEYTPHHELLAEPDAQVRTVQAEACGLDGSIQRAMRQLPETSAGWRLARISIDQRQTVFVAFSFRNCTVVEGQYVYSQSATEAVRQGDSDARDDREASSPSQVDVSDEPIGEADSSEPVDSSELFESRGDKDETESSDPADEQGEDTPPTSRSKRSTDPTPSEDPELERLGLGTPSAAQSNRDKLVTWEGSRVAIQMKDGELRFGTLEGVEGRTLKLKTGDELVEIGVLDARWIRKLPEE